jgi:phosphoribosylformimino-5-aminoimidazole carboxamide ribotide isomerase
MHVIPAIDLKNGRCVRLRQGRADAETVYADDPAGMARHWAEAGGRWLHVIDLDGAFTGRPVHTAVIAEIARAVDMDVEVGGGLRNDADIRAVLDAGAARAIVGTRALDGPETLRRLAETYGPRVVVGIDARAGMVQVRGWVDTSGVRAVDLAADAAVAGVRTLIVTDTATDGMLDGPNLAAIDTICAAVPDTAVIASGGVARAADVAALCKLGRANLAGVIVGKALYDGAVTLPELIAAAAGPAPAKGREA